MGEADQGHDVAGIMELALNDPAPAVDAANGILTSRPTPRDRVIALRARGLARRQLGEFDESTADLRDAIELADDLGDDNLRAEAGLTLAGTLVWQGRVEEARELLEDGVARSTGAAHAQSLYQLGTLHIQERDFARADAVYAQALPLIRELGQRVWEGNLIGNRGTMQLYRGNYDLAIDDLDTAIDLCQRFSSPSWTALYMNNKAYALQLKGDITESIDLYTQSEAFHDEHSLPKQMFAHRAQAYLAAGMYEETMALAQEAHRFHQESNSAVGAIEALLAGGDAALALGNHPLAIQLADTALGLDEQGAFPVWRAHAQRIQLEARLGAGRSTAGDTELALELFETADDAESITAARALLVGAAVAHEHNDLDGAADMLDLAAEPVASAPAHVRIERWTAVAAIATDHAQSDQVLSAADNGLRCFDELVAGVANYHVRYKAARHAERLASLTLRPLISNGQLSRAVDALEHARAGAMRLNDWSPLDDTAQPRHGETYLVWVETDEQLLCLRGTSADLTVIDCGSAAPAGELVEQHSFIYRQLARRSQLSEAAFEALLVDAAAVDQQLAEVLLPDELSRRVIINPSGLLQPVLWGALRPLASHEFTMSPSLAIAHRPLPSSIEHVAVLGSTELPHVPDEARAVAGLWDTQAELDPDPAAMAALAGTDLIHVAGHFVADGVNPLFSALPLGETRFRGNDYLQLDPPPGIAVLSACSSGLGETVAGAQVGFSSAALAAGTAAVIVSQAVLEDGPAIVAAMTQLHEALHAGHAPAEALRQVREQANPEDRSVAASLAVLGAGW